MTDAATGVPDAADDGDDPGTDAEHDAAVQRAAELLLGGGDLHSSDPNSLNLSPGQTVVLRSRDVEVQITPGRISAGTDACATGPLLTVALSVRVTRGSVDLALADFGLIGRDGSPAPAVEACSSGFAEAADERTVVFATAQPGRLAYGPDPDHLTAVWQLT